VAFEATRAGRRKVAPKVTLFWAAARGTQTFDNLLDVIYSHAPSGALAPQCGQRMVSRLGSILYCVAAFCGH
jgi:hypothetical protein